MTQGVPPGFDLHALRSVVQRNCHISDARFASDYTLCVYLLKMREFYRWESGRGFDDVLPSEEIGEWLSQRERFWESLVDEDFAPIELGGVRYDPFDGDAINALLAPAGLIYSGGYGAKSKPLFFLAELEQTVEEEGFTVHVAARELARDLTAPPAMALGDAIFIRRESLRRMLWEKLEEWRWHKPDNAMGRAIRHYRFDRDLDGALEKMTDDEIGALVLHEIGEIRAGEQLGDGWHDMIRSFPRSRVELLARAVRDHLADALSTLPSLVQRMHSPSLHFYFANLNGVRKLIYPTLVNAYEHWVQTGDCGRLSTQIETGQRHWLAVAGQMLELHRQEETAAPSAIESLIEKSHL